MNGETRRASVAAWLMVLGVLGFLAAQARAVETLEEAFRSPPPAARPWVFWFWLNGNITKEGLTADLEAMARAGIGGVLIMEVDQGAPAGPVAFLSDRWRELFAHAVAEAARLGLQVNMNNDAGWQGSGGPWVPLDKAMQVVTAGETQVAGGRRFEGVLPRPHARGGYYRDVAVLAFPTPAGGKRVADLAAKSAAWSSPTPPPLPRIAGGQDGEGAIGRGRIVDLTGKMDKDGRLAWDVPAGAWTLMRVGHTWTTTQNSPAPAGGTGPECDKLSPEGIELHFAAMMGKLIRDVGPLAGKTLTATHIDSWENGSQNWTPRMPQEFLARRGYDLRPFLPVLAGRVVDSEAVSERFLWDLRQTISELIAENYVGRLRTLANRAGLALSMEAYTTPGNDLDLANCIDEPICEFWRGVSWTDWTAKAMASAAHVNGRPVVGAEAFTVGAEEKWLAHPALLKAQGDRMLCDGVNRFIFHRYAMQPWTHPRAPGMTMGPWGLHYERTQTWWDFSGPWHAYLARCQHLLRQGLPVADVLALQPDEPLARFRAPAIAGYDFDACSPRAFLDKVSLRDGRLLTPGGVSYRLLLLPETAAMTPAMLGKVRDLVAAGAAVLGAPPQAAPGLSDYPRCDEQIRQTARDLWGDCDGVKVTQRAYGRGQVFRGVTPEVALARLDAAPDFACDADLRWIHRQAGDADIYFLANGRRTSVDAACTFRVAGKSPRLWRPDSGTTEQAGYWIDQPDGRVTLPIHLEACGSVFVVFRPGPMPPAQRVTGLHRDGRSILMAKAGPQKVVVAKAMYGVLDDPNRTRDVRAKLQAMADRGELHFPAARLAAGDDPAYGTVKTLSAEYTVGGRAVRFTGRDNDWIDLAAGGPDESPVVLRAGPEGRPVLDIRQGGRYEVRTADGKSRTFEAATLAQPATLAGPWEVRFDPGWGGPTKVTFQTLDDWSARPEEGIKYYSGMATYDTSFTLPPGWTGPGRRVELDLGDVQVMAKVSLNGQDLGILWRPPYRVDVTRAARTGENRLAVHVVNLWPNRMIGDERLAEDSDRNPDGTLRAWPAWVSADKPSPAGRFTFTSWRLWKKSDSLAPSGLLGPVTVRPAAVIDVGAGPEKK